MDTRQLSNVKRIGTGFAAGLMVLSLGLMVRGWTVPTKAAFDAGVFGFQLFPIAVSAILVRMVFPLILDTALGRMLTGFARLLAVRSRAIGSWFLRSSNARSNKVRAVAHTGYRRWVPVFPVEVDDPLEIKDPMGSPLRKGYTNTSPGHESYISNPDGYIPDYDAMFGDED